MAGLWPAAIPDSPVGVEQQPVPPPQGFFYGLMADGSSSALPAQTLRASGSPRSSAPALRLPVSLTAVGSSRDRTCRSDIVDRGELCHTKLTQHPVSLDPQGVLQKPPHLRSQHDFSDHDGMDWK